MRGEVLGVERRRRWSDERKLAIVLEVGVDGATTTQVAQRHEITRSQIYGWRRELKGKGLLPTEAPVRFLSLEAMPAEPVQGEAVSPGMVEIVLRGGRSLKVPAGIAGEALVRLIRAVEAA